MCCFYGGGRGAERKWGGNSQRGEVALTEGEGDEGVGARIDENLLRGAAVDRSQGLTEGAAVRVGVESTEV